MFSSIHSLIAYQEFASDSLIHEEKKTTSRDKIPAAQKPLTQQTPTSGAACFPQNSLVLYQASHFPSLGVTLFSPLPSSEMILDLK